MLKMTPPTTRLKPVEMSVASLMQRPSSEFQNYEHEILPMLRLYGVYHDAFIKSLINVPGTFFGVFNFNLRDIEPDWCKAKLNLFDMKIGRRLLGRKWSKKPESERPRWIAIPERATFLHYNSIWDVPIQHQEKFFLEAPGIWCEIVPSGQFHLQVIGEESGEAEASRSYGAKAFHPIWTIDNMITSKGLRRKK